MQGRIPREFINELLTRCDIVELIDARVSLRKKGNNYVACCPFHNEKTPSFSVSQPKQFYHCFGCGMSGNAISFLMDYDHLSFVESIELLAGQVGLEVPREAGQLQAAPQADLYQIMEQAARFYQQQLRQHPQAIDYLKSRGLSGEIAKVYGIGYAPAGWDTLLKTLGQPDGLLATGLAIKKPEGSFYDRFRERIMFPIRDRRGRVIAFGGRIIGAGEPKYLNSPETAIFHKGSELYGIFETCKAVRKLEKLLVVEGYMDVVALAQHGIRNVVATLGTATTQDHVRYLFRLTQEIVFCFDGDRAGQTAAWRALETTLPILRDGWQVKFLFLSEGEDPDSVVRKIGPNEFNKLIIQASTLPEFFLKHLVSQVDLSNLEGKARLAKLATPLLSKMPEGVYQHMLFEKLAQLVRMDIPTFKRLTGMEKTTNLKPTNGSQARLKRSPMRLAIALIVQNPKLATQLDIQKLANYELPGGELLREVVGFLQASPELNTGMLLENWRERAEYRQLEQLAGWDLEVPEAGMDEELQGVLELMNQFNREAQIELLLQKANMATLTVEERQFLQELISASKA